MIQKKAIIIAGPTASGKSSLALKMAEEQEISIINADSLQIYEGLPILSSQPTEEDQKKVKHLLYSCLKPTEYSSVASWLQLAKSAIDEVLTEGKIPVIVGGSGMYIEKLLKGIVEIPQIEEAARNDAKELYAKIGQEEFQQKLIDLGEKKILDRQRLIRAYEVFLQTGKTISYWQKQPNKKIIDDVDFDFVCLNPDRKIIYENCNSRFEEMLDLGVLEEVKEFVNLEISDEKQVTKTLGFYEIRDFLAGKISREKMVDLATQKTRNYAKRQITWFRNCK